MIFRSKWESAILLSLIAMVLPVSASYGSSPAYLPNSAATPGAINPAVTQSNIQSTICVSGFTATIRPPASYTTRLKIQQLSSSPYSAYGDTKTSDFEEDHLISLELGGNPTDPKNLWPEPWNGPNNAHVKDKIENKLHSLVCSGALPLATAQNEIATNWYAAYLKYESTTASTVSVTSPQKTVVAPSTPTPATSASWPAGATAKCNDGTYSFSATHRGSCSRHQGVEEFKQ